MTTLAPLADIQAPPTRAAGGRVRSPILTWMALPALLFNALSQRSVAEVLNPAFIAIYAGGALIVMAAGILWARNAGKSISGAAIAGMGMSCPNSGFIGFPLVAQVVGTAADCGVTLADVEIARPDLESVFLHLTGKGLRE